MMPTRAVSSRRFRPPCHRARERGSTSSPEGGTAPKTVITREGGCEIYLPPHPEERPPGRVSKDGRESMHCVHPSRRLLRKLLRMRSIFFTGSEERPLGRVSKDGHTRSWFETRARARSSP